VRIRREVKGRKGKTVTTISGLPLSAVELKELAGRLKRKCGSGGSIRDGVVEIQGDHVDLLLAELSGLGYSVRRSGG
jgi:translation initiation factor 1